MKSFKFPSVFIVFTLLFQLVLATPALAAPDVQGDCGADHVNTALGCLNVGGDGTAAITTILSWATGVSGGIAFIMIIVAAFQITTAAGDAKKVQAGKELLYAALAGIFFIAFSVVILNFLGVKLLGITV